MSNTRLTILITAKMQSAIHTYGKPVKKIGQNGIEIKQDEEDDLRDIFK